MGTDDAANEERDHALRTIDWEIAHARSLEARPGWTPWLLIGGLAAVVWAALGQGDLFKVDLGRFLVTYLCLRCSFAVALELRNLLKRPDPTPRSLRWHTPLGQYSGARVQLLLSGVDSLLLAFISFSRADDLTAHHFLRWVPIITAALFAFLGLMPLAAIAMSFLRLPTSNAKSKRFTLVATGIVLSAIASIGTTGLLAGRWVLRDAASAPAPASSSLKLAVLSLAAFWLLGELAKESTAASLIESLVAIRRDLAQGRIAASDALARADIAVEGMRVSDAFKDDIADMLKASDRVAQLRQEELAVLDAARKLIEGKATADSATCVAFDACIDKSIALIHATTPFYIAFRRKAMALEGRLDRARKGEGEDPDAASLRAKVIALSEAMAAQDKAVADELKRLDSAREAIGAEPKVLPASSSTGT